MMVDTDLEFFIRELAIEYNLSDELWRTLLYEAYANKVTDEDQLIKKAKQLNETNA